MDPTRFDALTRFFSATTIEETGTPEPLDTVAVAVAAVCSRRAALRLLAATVLGGVLPGPRRVTAELGCKAKGESCNPARPSGCCSRRCRNGTCACTAIDRGECTRSRDCCFYPHVLCQQVGTTALNKCCLANGEEAEVIPGIPSPPCCGGGCRPVSGTTRFCRCCATEGKPCPANPKQCCGRACRAGRCCVPFGERCERADAHCCHADYRCIDGTCQCPRTERRCGKGCCPKDRTCCLRVCCALGEVCGADGTCARL
jgi:hypothetical protein